MSKEIRDMGYRNDFDNEVIDRLDRIEKIVNETLKHINRLPKNRGD